MRWATKENVAFERIGSAWLITRFIDPGAEFVFVPGGTDPASIPKAIAFHLRGAALHHTEQMTDLRGDPREAQPD